MFDNLKTKITIVFFFHQPDRQKQRDSPGVSLKAGKFDRNIYLRYISESDTVKTYMLTIIL